MELLVAFKWSVCGLIQDSTNDDEAEPLSDQLVGAIDGALGCIQVVSLRSNITKRIQEVDYNLNGLKDLTLALLQPTAFYTFGPYGYLIGLEMYCLLVIFSEQNRDDDDLKESVASVDSVPLIQMDHLRAGVQECLVWAETQSEARLTQWRLLAVLLGPMPVEHARGLQQLSSSFGLSFLSLVYSKVNGAPAVEDFLDGVSSDQGSYENWSRLVDFVCSEHVVNPLYKKPRPRLHQLGTTYATLVNLHGGLVEETLEHAILLLRRNGFAGFFGALPRAMAADIDVFIKVAELLPFYRFESADLDPLWGDHVVKLSRYFLDSLVNDIQEFWVAQYDPGQPNGGESYAELSRQAAEVLRLRAFVELCHRHSQYLVFPYNIPSDLYYGLLDYPRGLVQFSAGVYGMFTKPAEHTRAEMQESLPQDLDSAFQIAKSTLYHHPLRFLTSMAVTDVRGGAVANRLATLSQEQLAKSTCASSSSADVEVVVPLAPSEIAAADIAAGNIRSVDQVSTVTDLFHFVKNRGSPAPVTVTG